MVVVLAGARGLKHALHAVSGNAPARGSLALHLGDVGDRVISGLHRNLLRVLAVHDAAAVAEVGDDHLFVSDDREADAGAALILGVSAGQRTVET